MFLKRLLIFVAIIHFIPVSAEYKVEWTVTDKPDKKGYSSADHIQFTPYGNIVWIGTKDYQYSWNGFDGSIDVEVTKELNTSGYEVWQSTFVSKNEGGRKGVVTTFIHYPVGIDFDPSGNPLILFHTPLEEPRFGVGYLTIRKHDIKGRVLYENTLKNIKVEPGSGDIKTDDEGNIFICASLVKGTEGKYSKNIGLIKLSSEGKYLWRKEYDTPNSGEEYANDISLDSTGNIFIVGAEQSVGENVNAIILKYDPLGNLLWKYSYNSKHNGGEGFNGIALNKKDDMIYVVGLSVENGKDDTILLKVNQKGRMLWDKVFKAKDSTQGVDIEVDSNGNLIVAVQYMYKDRPKGNVVAIKTTADLLEWNQKLLAYYKKHKFEILKFSNDGTTLWSSSSLRNNAEANYIRSLTLDSDDNIFASGVIYYDTPETKFWVRKYVKETDDSTNNNPSLVNFAVMDFVSETNGRIKGDLVSNLLVENLVENTRFNVIERNEVKNILDEIKFQNSGCTSEECAVEIGKLLSVNKIIVGNVYYSDSRTIMSVKVVDVETAKVEFAKSVAGNKYSKIEPLIEDIAIHIKNKF